MLRALIWLLALFAAAVALVLASQYNAAYALFVWPPWRVQISMNLLIVLTLVVFFLLYALSRDHRADLAPAGGSAGMARAAQTRQRHASAQ